MSSPYPGEYSYFYSGFHVKINQDGNIYKAIKYDIKPSDVYIMDVSELRYDSEIIDALKQIIRKTFNKKINIIFQD